MVDKYLYCDYSKMRRAELVEVAEDVPVEFIPYATDLMTVKELRQAIKAARKADGDSKHPPKKAGQRTVKNKPAKFSGLTASEVNEWLRTLPPADLAL